MKNFILCLIVLVYSVPSSFDVQRFLTDSAAAGIKLSAANEADSPHGYLDYDGGTRLTVALYDKAVAPIAANKKKRYPGQAGNAVLSGKLRDYGPKLQAIIDTQAVPK